MENRLAWEAESRNWLRWARTPGHDSYWYYRDAFFDQILSPPGELTLEVGCGEGRVARDLVARGHRVVALDTSPSLLGAAVASDGEGRFVLADAAHLPLRDASVDVAVAYNSLMDFDDAGHAVHEVARVLRPDCAFCICVPHPFVDAGHFDGDEVDAPLVLRGEYFGTKAFEETIERARLAMRFRGWSRSLEEYFALLAPAGFVVDAVREPAAPKDALGFDRWQRYPMFLHLRAIRR